MNGPLWSRIREERASIALELGRLRARDEQLIRQEERLRAEEDAVLRDPQPYLVRGEDICRLLTISPSGFARLRKNKAKGFPLPVEHIDSDPRWEWAEVQSWAKREP